jgi:DNA-binding transcriptional ArsR family regulator
MAPDLLSKIHNEIDERLSALRPLLAEYERLLVAAEALVATDRQGTRQGTLPGGDSAAPDKGPRRAARAGVARRGSAAGAIKLAAASTAATARGGQAKKRSTRQIETTGARAATRPRRSAAKRKPDRAARGAAREAILAALEHGSHTVGELVVVTAMSGPNINGNLRKLVAEGAVMKTEREGKAAWALSDVMG